MVIVFDEKVLDHEQWEGHPESPFRIKTLKKKLMNEGLWNDVIPPRMITDDHVLKVHTERHLERLKTGGNMYIDPDTLLMDKTYEFAMMAASIAATAVRLASEGMPSLAVTRPPGHHAGKDTMGGFCYLNNVSIAVEALGLRTAIVDLDVHHGNGTEEIFYGRSDILFIDFHQAGLYTGTGAMEDIGDGEGERYTVNIPIPMASGNQVYKKAMDEIAIPILREFKPDLIVVSLGVDAHYCNPNSHMNLNTNGYIDLCRSLIDESNGKIAFILEGGYHLRSTAEVVAGVMAVLNGTEIQAEYNEERFENIKGSAEIDKLREHLGKYWNLDGHD
ncbi:MAG: histone deacetylase [Methanomassiliicoccaceae archaeon]|nr:histone deacetylase [Methanomassiliicoccaceae archaeon]